MKFPATDQETAVAMCRMLGEEALVWQRRKARHDALRKQAGRPAHYRPTNWQLGGVAIFPKLIVEIGIQTLKQSSIVRP